MGAGQKSDFEIVDKDSVFDLLMTHCTILIPDAYNSDVTLMLTEVKIN